MFEAQLFSLCQAHRQWHE